MKSLISMIRSMLRVVTESFDRPGTASDQLTSKFIGLL